LRLQTLRIIYLFMGLSRWERRGRDSKVAVYKFVNNKIRV